MPNAYQTRSGGSFCRVFVCPNPAALNIHLVKNTSLRSGSSMGSNFCLDLACTDDTLFLFRFVEKLHGLTSFCREALPKHYQNPQGSMVLGLCRM
jgi:hypothetical protein